MVDDLTYFEVEELSAKPCIVGFAKLDEFVVSKPIS